MGTHGTTDHPSFQWGIPKSGVRNLCRHIRDFKAKLVKPLLILETTLHDSLKVVNFSVPDPYKDPSPARGARIETHVSGVGWVDNGNRGHLFSFPAAGHTHLRLAVKRILL